jgi:(-)-alpha-terpineol synthase
MEAMENQLPEYMKICYVAMLNFANEVVFDVLKDHGLNTFPYIKEAVSQRKKNKKKIKLNSVPQSMP